LHKKEIDTFEKIDPYFLTDWIGYTKLDR